MRGEKDRLLQSGDGSEAPWQRDPDLVRFDVRRIIDSYTLCMVGVDAEPYIEACADDVLNATLGWPVRYEQPDTTVQTVSGWLDDDGNLHPDPEGISYQREVTIAPWQQTP